MFLLKIIAALAALFGLYVLTQRFNDFTEREANYRFFTGASFGWYAASYIAMYAGYRMIQTNWHGDPINGSIVLGVGIIIYAVQIYTNFKRTRFLVALAGSLMQTLLYVPLTVLGLIALFIAIAAASQIKPVFNLNSKD
ncbi:hypothetical protein E0765_08580 [Sulfuricurvum sp. IAE1]|uniref:hypothetical protein n=1 Tax=Sulfuricurvum sp. IAE1 TaxID=2546102 RepID=UPI001047F560|nr:hypothetical protein [Sulfuricurvum sp. IAE1]TDA63249.1 hypothetical protein E0765_08580 [Sulfuricurvum sp. IAE1]